MFVQSARFVDAQPKFLGGPQNHPLNAVPQYGRMRQRPPHRRTHNRISIEERTYCRVCAAFPSVNLSIKTRTLASTRRPALRSSASLSRRPTSCKLVTGTALSFTGIGIASAGFPAKFTATVFCRFATRTSNRYVLPMSGIVGGRV